VQATGVPGVSPVKRWNPSRAHFEPRPPGEKWQKGFSVVLAYGPDAAVIWEQWGAGAWMGFTELFRKVLKVAPAQLPNLPLIMPGAPVTQKFAQGPSLKPIFSIQRFEPPPECLLQLAAVNMEMLGHSQPAIARQVPPAAARPAVQSAGWGAPAEQATPVVAPRQPIKPIGWGPAANPTPPDQSGQSGSESDPLDDTPPF
jgi:hypothetical protein